MINLYKYRKLILMCCLLAGGGWQGVYNVHADNVNSMSGSASQQTLTATGNVSDDFGPVAGASVLVKGTTIGTVTDIDGKFTLDNVKNGDVLVVSFIGYVTQEITFNGKVVNVDLREDALAIEEVVVTGYGTTLRKNLTTAIVKVNADDVQKTAVSNTSQLLMGRAAGLQATISSSQPGGNVDVSIRGGGTPIYVVDGVMIPADNFGQDASANEALALPASVNRGGMAGLNPDDIESIEILKDASAAIYGVNAANGVILITTKKGAEGKTRITYNGSVSTVQNYPYLGVLNGNDYRRYRNLFAKEAYLFSNNMAPYGNNSFDNNLTLPYTDADIANAQTTDWQEQVLRTGSVNSHSLTLQGGTKELNYYLSGNYFAQTGTVSKSDMERFTLHSRVATQLFDFLKLATVINVNQNQNNNGTVGGSTVGRGEEASGALASAMYYPTDLPLKDANGKNTVFVEYPDPVGLEKVTNASALKGTDINFTADIDIIKNTLTAKLLYGFNQEQLSRELYIPSDVWFDKKYTSRGNLSEVSRQNTTLEGTVAFNHQIKELLRIDAVVGMGLYRDNGKSLSDSYTDINDIIGNDNIGAATGTHLAGSARWANEKRSQFGRATLDLLDKYVLSGSLRRDGTDKFFPSKKYALFPAVSAAWKISNEKFLENVSWISLLKLRGSYGVTGNDNLGTSLYGSYGPYDRLRIAFNNNTVYYVPYILNGIDYPDITWEKTTMKNVGVDLFMIDNRISIGLDYFVNDVTNMLGDATSDGLSMFPTKPVNGGHVRRYGWDASIKTKNISNRYFNWTSILSLSHYNAVWKERMPNYDYNPYQVQEDEPVSALYFYRTDGIVNADKSNMPSYQPESFQMAGMPIIKDLNGDNVIDYKDVDMVNVIPKLYWGFGNTFNYKSWDLDIFIYSQLGLRKNNPAYTWNNIGNLNRGTNVGEFVKDVWRVDNPGGTLPGLAYQQSGAYLPEGASTDIGYEDASFLRVRNITLGYNLPGQKLGAAGKYIRNIRVYADAQNPFIITGFKYFDPEVYTGDTDSKVNAAEYPQTKTFSLGIKLSF